MPTNQQAREYYDKLKIHHSNLIETLKRLQNPTPSSSLSIESVQQFEIVDYQFFRLQLKDYLPLK